MSAETKDGFVDTNGIRTYYQETGEGPPIVFIHGIDLNLTYWQPEVEFFSRRYRAVAYDLRGMGKSGGANPEYEFDAYLADLTALLAALGIDRPVLCGHSLGADIILQYGISRPDGMRALVVADAPAPDNWVTSPLAYELQKVAIDVLRVLHPLDPLSPLAPATQHLLYSRAFQEANPEAMAAFRQQYASNSVDGVLHAAKALAFRKDNTEELPQITAPTLLLRGSKDRIVSQGEMDTYHSQIAGSTLEILDGSGHMTLQEQPEKFNGLMEAFLTGLPPA